MSESAKQYRSLPLSVGIETVGGVTTPLAIRGTPLPTKRTSTFSTASDDQKVVTIRVLAGESPLAAKNVELARVDLRGIKPMPRGKPQVAVTFSIDRSFSVTVTAVDKASKKEIEAQTTSAGCRSHRGTDQGVARECKRRR